MVITQPSLRDTIQTFFRRKFTFLLIFGGACFVGAAYLFFTTPLYESGASLVVRFDQHTVPDIDRSHESVQPLGSNERREIIYSDADILRSPDLLRRAIAEIGLARLYPKIASDGHDQPRQDEEALKAFNSDLVVDVGLQSDVINLTLLNPEPVVARDAVKSLIDQFFGQEAIVYANPQLKFTEQEATRQRDKLTAAQQALAQFKNTNQIADLNAQVGQLLKQRTDVESRLTTAQGRVQEAEQREAALKELLSAVPATVTTSAVGEQYRGLDDVQTQIATLKAKRDQMASTYRPGSPVFKQLDASIGSLESAAAARNHDARTRGMTQTNLVYENIKTDLLRASAEAQSARQPAQLLATQLAQINQSLADLEKQSNQYDDLQRSVSIQDAAYRSMAIRLEEARAEANRNAEKISAAAVIAVPVVPEMPARPRRKLVAFATVLTALVLACGAVLGAEAFDDRLRSPRDVTQVLRVPVLATFAEDT
jgi:uncharacterized protein involved in exopolysaccharide biosynthesis